MGDAVLALTDGRLASQRARDEGLHNLVLFDLALDYATAGRIGISWSADTTPAARDQAVALLQAAGLVVSPLADVPGLLVMRTVAMLANEAADAVLQGVATAADVDLAMRKGVNYPKARWPGPTPSARRRCWRYSTICRPPTAKAATGHHCCCGARSPREGIA